MQIHHLEHLDFDNLPEQSQNYMFSLVCEVVRVDVDHDASDGLGRLDGQVEVNVNLEDIQRFLHNNCSRVNGARVG